MNIEVYISLFDQNMHIKVENIFFKVLCTGLYVKLTEIITINIE